MSEKQYAITPEGANVEICEHGRTSWHYTMPTTGVDWSHGLGPICDIWAAALTGDTPTTKSAPISTKLVVDPQGDTK